MQRCGGGWSGSARRARARSTSSSRCCARSAALAKGISAPTLTIVVDAVRAAEDELTAVEVADRAGISRGTARRYLEYLATLGTVELSLRYGAAGRPEHLYRWAGAQAGSRPS